MFFNEEQQWWSSNRLNHLPLSVQTFVRRPPTMYKLVVILPNVMLPKSQKKWACFALHPSRLPSKNQFLTLNAVVEVCAQTLRWSYMYRRPQSQERKVRCQEAELPKFLVHTLPRIWEQRSVWGTVELYWTNVPFKMSRMPNGIRPTCTRRLSFFRRTQSAKVLISLTRSGWIVSHLPLRADMCAMVCKAAQ